METLVLLLLGVAFALLAWSAWRHRTDGDPASSVEGFARVLAAIDPAATTQTTPEGRPASVGATGEFDVESDADGEG